MQHEITIDSMSDIPVEDLIALSAQTGIAFPAQASVGARLWEVMLMTGMAAGIWDSLDATDCPVLDRPARIPLTQGMGFGKAWVYLLVWNDTLSTQAGFGGVL